MEFDESKVYTTLNADKLKVGSMIIAADTLTDLKVKVSKATRPVELLEIKAENYLYRFVTADEHYELAYLVEELAHYHYCVLKDGFLR